MEKKMTFNYFYGTEADQFSFYRIYHSGYKSIWNFCTNLCRRMPGINRPSDKGLYE